jgi:DNA-directed RNA polymerase subunit RPC12/RpoP
MDRAQCPECGFLIGLGNFSEPGRCPACGSALLLTAEMRLLTPEQLAAVKAQADETTPPDQAG